MKNFSVSVIIPNYNGGELLSKNLPSILLAKKNIKNRIKEIIVVDDASTDDSLSILKNNFSEVKVIKHKINRGYSASVNIGARASTGDLLLLLNNDVTVSQSFLSPVFKNFLDDRVFAVSLHEKGYGASSGYFKDGYIQLKMKKESTKIVESLYVSGGSGIYRKSIWQELSGMDEKLLSPFYWEDIDLSYRAWKRGYINLWDPECNIVHQHESTISKLPKKNIDIVKERNRLLMLWKNIHSRSLMSKHVIGVISRSVKHIGYLKVVFVAIFKIGILIKARNKELRECKISDEAIFERFHD